MRTDTGNVATQVREEQAGAFGRWSATERLRQSLGGRRWLRPLQRCGEAILGAIGWLAVAAAYLVVQIAMLVAGAAVGIGLVLLPFALLVLVIQIVASAIG